MSSRLFGTDGVRGLANGLLTAKLATALGIAAANVLGRESSSEENKRARVIVGRDPRASGEFLQAAISAGLASAGVDVIDVGVVPTPAVAFLTDATDAAFGVMISASHNAMPDNGIKFFARGGVKLSDTDEDAIENALSDVIVLPTGSDVGRIRTDENLLNLYLDHLNNSISQKLDGITVVIDGANGSASVLGPEALRRAGARVIAINCEPDGLNINEDCGSTHMQGLQAAVVEHGADLGIANDGDADRCLAVDANGEFVDGDQILAILANGRKQRNELVGNTVVATVMSNLGFNLAMAELEIDVISAAVGDRYVLEEMNTNGFTIGGEQSGHVILREFATTGDGVLTALHLISEMRAQGKTLAELAAIMRRLPQVLINVSGVDKAAINMPEVLAALDAIQTELGTTGRVLLRSSGTEALIRVMIEAQTHEQAQSTAQALAEVVRVHCSLG